MNLNTLTFPRLTSLIDVDAIKVIEGFGSTSLTATRGTYA